MLTKENTSLWSPAIDYPTYEYVKGSRSTWQLDRQRVIPCPRGFKEVIIHQNEDEDFKDYQKTIKNEHADLSNKQLLEHPAGKFYGKKRNARWMDEIKQRNLV